MNPLLPPGKALKYFSRYHCYCTDGKTAAYLLPIIDELANQRAETGQYRKQQQHRPYAIIILPTRELVEQIYNDSKLLAERTDVCVVRTYGDIPMFRSISSM